MSLHDPVHGEMHWGGKYFGSGQAVEVARKKYEEAKANYTRCACVSTPAAETDYSSRQNLYDATSFFNEKGIIFCGPLKKKNHAETKGEYIAATIGYASTLYSALNHALVHAAKGRLKYLWLAKKTISELFKMVDEVRVGIGYLNLNALQKEVMMACLKVRSYFTFKAWPEEEIIELGNLILDDKEVSTSTIWLTKARLINASKISNDQRGILKEEVNTELSYAYLVEPAKDVEWSTYARVARQVGDWRKAEYFAKESGQPDVIHKCRTPWWKVPFIFLLYKIKKYPGE